MAARFQLVEGTPRHRTYRIVSWGLWLLVIVLVAFAFSDVGSISIGENTYNISVSRINAAIAFMIAILGLQVVVGFTGQVALGQSFFVGTGAYIAAWLVQDHHWPYLLTLIVVVPACFGLGVLFGIPALRIRGLYLALVTLGLAAVFPSIVQLDSLFTYTNGAGGKTVESAIEAPTWLPLDGIASGLQKIPWFGRFFGDGDLSDRIENRIWSYTLFVIVAFVCFWLVGNLVKSRPGRAIRAIRDNETGASVTGINLSVYKTLSFGVASALGGVAGLIYVAELGIASPGDFTNLLAINLIVGLVVGGVGTLSGAVVGGLVIAFVPDWASATQDVPVVPERWLQGPTGTLFLGVMLIALTFFLPGGVVAGARRMKARIVHVTPRLAAQVAGAGASDDPSPLDVTPLLGSAPAFDAAAEMPAAPAASAVPTDDRVQPTLVIPEP